MLDKLVRVAIVVLAVVVSIDVGFRLKMYGDEGRGVVDTKSAVRDLEGESFPAVPGVSVGSGVTVLLAVSDSCVYCQKSAPFYRRLSSTIADTNGQASLVGICPYGQPCEPFFTRYEIKTDQIISTSGESLRISGTPTIIVVDSKGVVRAVWEGAFRSEAEEEAALRNIRELVSG